MSSHDATMSEMRKQLAARDEQIAQLKRELESEKAARADWQQGLGIANTHIGKLGRELEEAREEKEEAGYAMGHWQIIAQDAEARVKEPETALSQVDDVLIVNWVGPRKDGDYRQALADLVTGAIQQHEFFTIQEMKERLAALISAAEPLITLANSPIPGTQYEIYAMCKALAGAVRKAREEKK